MAAPLKYLSTDEEFWQAVTASLRVRQVLGRMGLVPAGSNYKTVQNRIRTLGLETSYFAGAAWNKGRRYRAFGKCAPLAEVLLKTLPSISHMA